MNLLFGQIPRGAMARAQMPTRSLVGGIVSLIIPPVIPLSGGGGGGGFLPWNLRWEDKPIPEEDDDLEIVQILTYWLNRL